MTAVHIATILKNTHCIDMLLEKGCDSSQVCSDELTPLNYACGNGSTEIVRRLLKADTRTLNQQGGQEDLEGITPLHFAVLGGHIATVKLLLEEGADVGITNAEDINALEMAAQGGHASIVKLLVDNGAKINADLMSPDSDFYGTLKKHKYDSIILLLEVFIQDSEDSPYKERKVNFTEPKKPVLIRNYSEPKELFPSNKVFLATLGDSVQSIKTSKSGSIHSS